MYFIVFKFFLIIHIIGGALGLISGLINIFRKKGDLLHKKIGKIFFIGMITAGTSALVLSLMHSNYFLFIVGIFTLYMTLTGRRYLRLKDFNQIQKIDYINTSTMLITAIAFLIFGVYRLINHNSFGIVFIVFGLIGFRFSLTDFKFYRKQFTIKNYWLVGHLQRMMGSFIAAITAFLVVNQKIFHEMMPEFTVWILPTILLLPLIFIWTKKYSVLNKKEN